MDTSFYANLELEVSGSGPTAALTGTADSNQATGGPWASGLQHGGPPSALLVLLAETLAAQASGRTDLTGVRLAAEFLGPVPVAGLQLQARVERLSRAAVLISAALGTAERISLQARIWLLAPGEPHGDRPTQAPPATDPESLPVFGFDSFPYARHLDWRQVHGAPYEPGPAACWVAARIPLVPGQCLTGLQRTALFADSASGISSELSWQEWSFPNVDLELHLFREPLGEWLLLEAGTDLGAGVGLARSQISDRTGLVGSGAQTLLVRRS